MTTTIPSPGALSESRTGAFIALGFVILLSLSQLFVSAIVIPRFVTIFRDLFGGLPLPAATMMVLNGHWVFVSIACLASIAAWFMVQRRASLGYLFAILALLLLQIGITTVALFLPLIGVVQAMAPAQ